MRAGAGPVQRVFSAGQRGAQNEQDARGEIGTTWARLSHGAAPASVRAEQLGEQLGSLPPVALLEQIMAAVHRFVKDAVQSDDVTVVVLRYTGR